MELSEVAAGLGYDAVLVRNPCYYRPQLTAEALLHYFRTVADRSPLPVILYSIPKFAQAEIPLEVVAELAQHANIIGLKESSGSVERVRDVVQATRLAPRRTVTVTPIFEAVTGRMLRVKQEAAGSFISAEGLASGVSGTAVMAVAPPVPAIKTRTREVGFQVLTGSTANLKESLEAGASGAILAFLRCALRRPARRFTRRGRSTTTSLPPTGSSTLRRRAARSPAGWALPGSSMPAIGMDTTTVRRGPPLLPVTAEAKAEIGAAACLEVGIRARSSPGVRKNADRLSEGYAVYTGICYDSQIDSYIGTISGKLYAHVTSMHLSSNHLGPIQGHINC